MHQLAEKLYRGENLSFDESRTLFNEILSGSLDPCLIASVLTAMKMNGETPDEISGAALTLLDKALAFPRPDYSFGEIVGTGGDGAHSINISTTSAFVAAKLGVSVAKHGNRSVSSKTGAADLLESCGVNLRMSPETARKCLDELHVTFFFAQLYHSAMKYVGPVRKALGTRTIFNILGPLINPAHEDFILLGVYDPKLCAVLARTLMKIGIRKALVINGSGLDEVSISDTTYVAELHEDHSITEYRITPEDFGLKRYDQKEIEGGEPEENRAITERILSGKGTDGQNAAIAANTAALLLLAGKAGSLKEGASMAMDTLKCGKAIDRLHRFAEMSNGR